MASPLLDQLLADVKEAMKARDTDRVLALRTLHSEIKNSTVNAGKDPVDDDVIATVSRAIKQRLDAIEQFKAGGRDDLAAREQAQIDLFRKYQPRQMDAAEIEALVRKCAQEAGVTSARDQGKLMQMLMPQVKGKADGKRVSQIVQQVLSTL